MHPYQLLYPQDAFYNRMVHIVCIQPNSKVRCIAVCSPQELSSVIKNTKVYKCYNYYLTANTIKPGCPRRSQNLFSLCNIVLDLDIHDRMTQHHREHLVSELIWRLKRDLFSTRELPTPNMIHSTGRGLQLWWHLEETAAALLFLYQHIIDYMILIIHNFLRDNPSLAEHIQIDSSSSKNPVGLFRMINTYNNRTKTKTSYEILHHENYTLNGLKDALHANDIVANQLECDRQRKERTAARNAKSTNAGSKKIRNISTMLHKRLWIIQKLAVHLSENSSRADYPTFLAFNCARQIMSMDKAIALCQELNERLPTPSKHLSNLFNGRTIYRFKEETFQLCLGLPKTEYDRLCAEYYRLHSNDTRDSRRKQRKEENDRHKELAFQMLQDGKRIKDIASETGFSASTIAHMSAVFHKVNPTPKPWEHMGISRSTYYRRKKAGLL